MSNIKFRLTGGTHVGLVRTNNEDNFIVNADLTQQNWFIPDNTAESITLGRWGSLFVVADGMGGMNAGEVASAIAIDTIRDSFTNVELDSIICDDEAICNHLKGIVVLADDNIKSRVKSDKSTSGMGTTIVIGWVIGCKVHICWCGDSRAYLFNAKSGLKRLSKDHSYVQQLVDEGILNADLAFDHPNSNIITRSLGDSPQRAVADYTSQRLIEGDVVLLCSDGLCGVCRDEEILATLKVECDSIDDTKNNLITAALNGGGHDNVTVTLFQIVEAPEHVAFGMQTQADDILRRDTTTDLAPDNGAKHSDDVCKTEDRISGDSCTQNNTRNRRSIQYAIVVIIALCLIIVLLYFTCDTVRYELDSIAKPIIGNISSATK